MKTPLNAVIKGVAAAALILSFTSGCSPARQVHRHASRTLQGPAFQAQLTGLLLLDLQAGDTLYAHNPLKPFTPASNVKLLTLYAALKTLPERLPALAYTMAGDTLVAWGTANPAALHPDLADSTAFHFMQGFPRVALVNTHLEDPAWGPGWSWDDFDQYYTPTRSAFPAYGNLLRVIRGDDSLRVWPMAFRDSIFPEAGRYARTPEHNRFFLDPQPGDTLEVPLVTDPQRERQLWSQALGKPVLPYPARPGGNLKVLDGPQADSVYRRMMQTSDNFLAEQLMLMVSATLGDTLGFGRARDYVLDTYLADLPQRPKWVDGSGLSRYNLICPGSVVHLLRKLHREIPPERLLPLLAQGGANGTLKDWYRSPEGPYLFGKTGSLSNNHNLSGYLRTRSGKWVVFAFMNNHYLDSGTAVKARMEALLTWVREHY
ncbi:D-alanyl-D-alanine carboxypeptidase [Robiginitalea sp. M366]|uniref:D-alanyl-D-alanine carboxypeptidase n=1 Tax=Robiginitalea aestuariiviva TaxID=3036903 RepID=UPI00240E4AD8|nr:D-alanyl-D-alanine carboxypeptidase [Robiginitalea aestuariiviva]MDG1573402.1 D-alanyl-D-alanine carboxypeptidase [Robiginitalea aestuariiviva]